VEFLFTNAVWSGQDRDACRQETAGHPVGACWAFVRSRLNYFTYGSYPMAERWRVDGFFTAARHRRRLAPVAQGAPARPRRAVLLLGLPDRLLSCSRAAIRTSARASGIGLAILSVLVIAGFGSWRGARTSVRSAIWWRGHRRRVG
jgi:general L-amino acid transport system permease protein